MTIAFLSLKGFCKIYGMTRRQVDLIMENNDIEPDRCYKATNPLFSDVTVKQILAHKHTLQEKN